MLFLLSRVHARERERERQRETEKERKAKEKMRVDTGKDGKRWRENRLILAGNKNELRLRSQFRVYL